MTNIFFCHFRVILIENIDLVIANNISVIPELPAKTHCYDYSLFRHSRVVLIENLDSVITNSADGYIRGPIENIIPIKKAA